MYLLIYLLIANYVSKNYINNFTVFDFGIFATCCYLIPSFVFYILDQLQCFSKYNHPNIKYRNSKYYLSILPLTLLNLLINTICLIYSITIYPLIVKDINFLEIILQNIFFLLCYEILFYYLHRVLHFNKFYWIHKTHHTIFSDIGLSGIYMSTIDLLLEVCIPGIGGFIILNLLGFSISKVCMSVYISTLTINSVISHSGYQIKYFYDSNYHIIHHLMQNKNYGLSLLDYIHSTQY
jgi:sterol desaturase/sphingolipid hydroxylase (fatty acid hydroxylase superfamily)